MSGHFRTHAVPFSEIVIPGSPPIHVAIRRSARGRRLTLKVERVGGKVTMTVPDRCLLADARRFAVGRRGWIQQELAEAVSRIFPKFGAAFPLEGEMFTLGTADCSGVHRDGRNLLTACQEAELPAVLGEYCRGLAVDKLRQATRRHADRLSLPGPEFRIRDTRSRWGSCSSDGRLMFSWRLIIAPPDILDYVAAHEVSHLIELNHSPQFWDIVSGICPDHREHRKWLRVNGRWLHQYILN